MHDATPLVAMFDESEEESGIRLPTRHAERRGERRATLDVPVLVDCRRSWDTCQCHDVSVGGFSLQARGAWSVGTIVDTYFELPNGCAVETRARVVALSERRTHLSFVSLRPSARAAVASYVQVQSSPVARTLRDSARVRPLLRRLR